MTAGQDQADGSQQEAIQQNTGNPARPPGSSLRLRRRVHLSTAVTILLGIPWFVLSLVVVVGLAVLAASGNTTVVWVATGVFVVSGAAAFFGPTESVIARVMFRLRQPTAQERYRLDHMWHVVCGSAGVEPNRYRLWVQDSAELNAFATSGHIVGVTRASLDLPPHQLAAVLAHELGHHLGGHSWAAWLTYWYSIPGRTALRVLFWINHRVFAIVTGLTLGAAGGAVAGRAGADAAGCLIGPIVRLFPVFCLALITWFLYSLHPVLVLVWAIPLMLPWFSRYGEKYADRVAAEIGFGPPLLEVLYGWLNAGHDDARRRQGLRASLFASHPTCSSRIQALEKHLYGQNRTGGGA